MNRSFMLILAICVSLSTGAKVSIKSTGVNRVLAKTAPILASLIEKQDFSNISFSVLYLLTADINSIKLKADLNSATYSTDGTHVDFSAKFHLISADCAVGLGKWIFKEPMSVMISSKPLEISAKFALGNEKDEESGKFIPKLELVDFKQTSSIDVEISGWLFAFIARLFKSTIVSKINEGINEQLGKNLKEQANKAISEAIHLTFPVFKTSLFDHEVEFIFDFKAPKKAEDYLVQEFSIQNTPDKTANTLSLPDFAGVGDLEVILNDVEIEGIFKETGVAQAFTYKLTNDQISSEEIQLNTDYLSFFFHGLSTVHPAQNVFVDINFAVEDEFDFKFGNKSIELLSRLKLVFFVEDGSESIKVVELEPRYDLKLNFDLTNSKLTASLDKLDISKGIDCVAAEGISCEEGQMNALYGMISSYAKDMVNQVISAGFHLDNIKVGDLDLFGKYDLKAGDNYIVLGIDAL